MRLYILNMLTAYW